MRLLVCAQAIDRDDPVLGFFVRWIEELAKHYEQVTVICLRKGAYDLPPNVRVFALDGNGKISRTYKLLRGAYRFRGNYDAVLVHMSQEFVLAGGWLWWLLGKRVYLWRNHYAGSLLTDIAALFCTKVFCTSKFSYTAKYKKTVLMPVGVDTEVFKPMPGVVRKPRSVLFLARMAPSKRPELLIEALRLLKEKEREYTAAFYGSPAAGDEEYYEWLKEGAEGLPVEFHPAIPNHQTPELYSQYELFVNSSPSGMFDKTIFEAAACGCAVLSSSKDWRDLAGKDLYVENAEDLANRIQIMIATPASIAVLTDAQRKVVEGHSLTALGLRLSEAISPHV